MKKLIILVIIMFGFYFGIQYAFRALSPGFEATYTINNITIKETFTNKNDNNLDNYYFEINTGKNIFYLQTYKNFNKKQNIIIDVKYYQDDIYECILPIFRDTPVIMDFKCLNKSIVYNYSDIVGKSVELDKYVTSISLYDGKKFRDELPTEVKKGIVTAYQDNLIKNHALGMNSYRGVYTIDVDNLSIIYEVELFKYDNYRRPISAYVNNYYFTANYDQKYDFSSFYLVNLENSKDDSFSFSGSISKDSFVQGVVDNSVYVIDTYNKKQFEIDITKKTIADITNDGKAKHYTNGSFTELDINAIINRKLKFVYPKTSDLTVPNYYRIDKRDDEAGYYYFYKKVGNSYEVYRTPVRHTDQMTYLFKTTDAEQIKYVGHYVYYLDGTKIKVYEDSTNSKTILVNTELQYNDSLTYNVILK